jgi:2-iminoacetate synthase ThiH
MKDTRWCVFRQDDHGNQFLVATDLTDADAQDIVEEYEAKGHKQVYWVEEVE